MNGLGEMVNPKLTMNMKVTDLNQIKAVATEQLENYGGEILEFLTIDDAAVCLSMIYMTNDVLCGFAQDYMSNISVVSSPKRIAIIGFGRHSFYQVDENICGYERLTDDIEAIRITLDAALARWEDRRDG